MKLKKSILSLTVVLALIISFIPAALASDITPGYSAELLKEDFESCESEETPLPIDFTSAGDNGWTNGWVFVNAKDPAFTGTIDRVNGNAVMKFQIDQGNGRAHQKIRKTISDTGLHGIIEYKFKVFVPSGVDNGSGGTYNSGSGLGSCQVNIDDTNGVEIMAMYYTPGANGVEIRTCASNDSDGSDLGVSYGWAHYDTWIETTVYIDTESGRYYFNVSDNNGFNASVTESNSLMLRNALKLTNFTGIPKYASAYLYRKAKNTLAYLDDFSVGQVISYASAYTVSNYKFYDKNGETDGIKEGYNEVETSVKFNGVGSRKVALISAVSDSSGKLVELDSDIREVGSEYVSFKTGANLAAGQSYKYLLWDFETMNPLGVTKLKPVDSFKAAYIGSNEAGFSWTSTSDLPDYYIISRDGTELARTSEKIYYDSSLEAGTAYNYTIQAFKDSLSSELTSVTVVTESVPGVSFDTEVHENDMTFFTIPKNTGGDAYNKVGLVGGRYCRTTERLNRPKYSVPQMYFSIGKNLITPDDRNVTFEVTYFDEGTGGMYVQYNSTSNIATEVKIGDRTDTKVWKTGRVSVSDAQFVAAAALNSSDFRVTGKTDVFSVAEVKAEKTEYFGKGPDKVMFNGETQEQYFMNALIDGETYYFDSESLNASNKNIEVSVEYLDKDGVFNISYKNGAGETVTIPVTMTNTNSYVKKTFLLEDVLFDGSFNGYDFTVSGASLEIYEVKAAPKYTVAGADFSRYSYLPTGYTQYEGLRTYNGNGGNDALNTIKEITDADGVTYTARSMASGKQLYFDVSDQYIYKENCNSIALEITYLDEGTGLIRLEFNGNTGSNPAYVGYTLATRTNTGLWKTLKTTVNNINFRNAQNGGSDFRLNGNGPELNIAKISVSPVVFYPREREYVPTVFLAGDSTCEPLTSAYAPREGWGMELPAYFTSSVKITNLAKGGKSSRSFLNDVDPTASPVITDDGRMDKLLASCKPGDYLFIQFGHNDRTQDDYRYTDPNLDSEDETSYRNNLRKFVQIAKSNGIIPVFLTSIRERKFADGVVTGDGIEAYRQAMRDVAAELDVPLLDVGAEHEALLNTWGEEASKQLFVFIDRADYPKFPASVSTADNTHISKTGAVEVCKIISRLISENDKLTNLQSYLSDADTTPATPQ